MADTYITRLRVTKMEVGARENTWGAGLNDEVIALFDEAISGQVSVSLTAGNATLTALDGTTDEARNALIILTGTPGSTRTVTFPDVEKLTFVKNTSDSTANLTAGAGTTVSLPTLQTALVYTDGATNTVALWMAPSAATLVGTTATQTLTNKTLTSPVIGTDITIPNTGLHLLDTNASHDLIIKPGSDLTADRTLTVTTGDADRTLTLSADLSYSEGTFTPGLAFGGAATGITYGTQVGRYVKIGRVVIVTACTVALTSRGSATGSATLTGLPFTITNTSGNSPEFPVGGFTMASISGQLQAWGTPNTTVLSLQHLGTGTVANLTEANFNNTTTIQISGVYETAS